MTVYTIALFGEAEKGQFRTAYFCQTLEQLDDYFGNPPLDSKGLFYAVQSIMFKRDLIYFRIPEEGFSYDDYLAGLRILENQQLIPQIAAICTPGLGDQEIIKEIHPICHRYHSIHITSEADFYDYLTSL